MKNNRLIALTFSIAMLWNFQASAQYNLSMYQLNEVLPQSHYLNPAFTPDRKVHIGIPVLSYTNVYVNNSFSLDDIIQRVNKDSLLIDYNGYARDNLPDNNYTYINQEASLLYAGFRISKNYISITISERMDFNSNYPRDLLDIFLSGNAHPDYYGKNTEFNKLHLHSMAWMEYAAAFNRRFLNDKLSAGIRLKYLNGIVSAAAGKNMLIGLQTDTQSRDILIRTQDVVLNTAGFETLEDAEDSEIVRYGFNSNNNGFGIDLGATYQLNEKINLTTSIRDIGSITWKNSVTNYNIRDQEYVFTGIDLTDTDDFMESLEDTLTTLFEPEETHNSFKTRLSSQYYLGGTYQIAKKSHAGVLFQGKSTGERFVQSITLSYLQEAGKFFNGILNYSLMDGKPANLGLGMVFSFGFFQLYGVTDNVIPIISPNSGTNTSFQFGINLNFGKVKTEFVPLEEPFVE